MLPARSQSDQGSHSSPTGATRWVTKGGQGYLLSPVPSHVRAGTGGVHAGCSRGAQGPDRTLGRYRTLTQTDTFCAMLIDRDATTRHERLSRWASALPVLVAFALFAASAGASDYWGADSVGPAYWGAATSVAAVSRTRESEPHDADYSRCLSNHWAAVGGSGVAYACAAGSAQIELLPPRSSTATRKWTS